MFIIVTMNMIVITNSILNLPFITKQISAAYSSSNNLKDLDSQ